MTDQELKEKIVNVIWDLDLDLMGKVVITEAANGPYCVTPLIAALAGARVFALAKPSSYGTVDDVFDFMQPKVESLGLNSVFFLEELSPEIIKQADIITNSGHLRPLNANKLQHVKPSCVVPLMYEQWELRAQDIDLNFCHKNGIQVGATNERHSSVGVFEYLGDMAIELIRRSGLQLEGNKFVLVCNNDFGPYIAKTFIAKNIPLGVIDRPENRHLYPELIDWIGGFPEVQMNESYENAAGVIFTAYPFDQVWIGSEHEHDIKTQQLKQCFKDATILRFAGDLDEADLNAQGIKYYPTSVGKGHMGILPSDIGFDPVIRLQAGGLKVAQAMHEKNFILKNEPIGELLSQ